MARKSKVDKILDIEKQIEKMQQEKALLLEKLERSIGKTVIKEWNSYDEKALIECIKMLSEEAKKLLSTELNDDEQNTNLNNYDNTQTSTSTS